MVKKKENHINLKAEKFRTGLELFSQVKPAWEILPEILFWEILPEILL